MLTRECVCQQGSWGNTFNTMEGYRYAQLSALGYNKHFAEGQVSWTKMPGHLLTAIRTAVIGNTFGRAFFVQSVQWHRRATF
eukprot:SAG11_NODE_28100_length_325_cov_1.137168_1_plen_81_part_01